MPDMGVLPPLFSEIFHPTILTPLILVGGDWGSGKTFLLCHHPLAEQGVFLDLEMDRYGPMIECHPELRLGKVINITQLKKDYGDDPIKTYDALDDNIKQNFVDSEWKMVVIDGVSDVRRMASAKWCAVNKRKNPMNWGDWGQINDMVKDTLFRSFNYAKVTHKVAIVTALIVDKVGDVPGAEVKRVLEVKNYVTARVDEVIYCKNNELKFFARRKKSPRGPTRWVDVTFGSEQNDGTTENKESETDLGETE